MSAKVRVVSELENARPATDPRALTSPAAIMDSLVATEAELRELWAQSDQFVAAGSRPSAKRIGVV